MKKTGGRALAALLALVAIVLLAQSLAAPESAARRVPLLAVAALGILAFARPPARWLLFVLVPAGPVLDFAFLTPARGVYATEVVLLAALAATLASTALGRLQTPWAWPARPALLLAAFGVAGALALLAGHADAMRSFVGWRALRVLALTTGAVFLLTAVGRQTSRPLPALWTGATLGVLLLLGGGGVAEFAWRGGGGQFEAGSFYGSAIGLSMHLAMAMPLALCVALGPSPRGWRLVAGAAWLLAFVCLPLTASRGALASVAITTALAVVVAVRRSRSGIWRPLAALVLVVVVGGVVLVARPELAGEAFAYKFRASVAGDFLSTRTTAWTEARAAIAARPLDGEGPHTWVPSVPLELARRHGVPAALLALAAIGAAAVVAGRRGWRLDGAAQPNAGEVAGTGGVHDASLAWGLALGLVGLLLVGLAETGLGARSTPLLALTIVMVDLVARR